MNPLQNTIMQGFADMASAISNQAIASDPALAARLASLEGRCVEFQCTTPPITWHLLIRQQGIQTMAGAANAPHAVVTGSASALSSWGLPNGSHEHLQIDGDELLVLQLMEMFKSFSPDLTQGLSSVLPQDTANAIVGAAELGMKGMQTFFDAMRDGLQQQAVDPFVKNSQLDTLLTGIDSLRLRVDRLAANIAAAEQRRRSSSL